jgi:hypothetical protein
MISLVTMQVASPLMPAFAQSRADGQRTAIGAFGGAQLRIPLGGARREPIRVGLSVAPTSRTAFSDGHTVSRIGEGLEFGYLNGRGASFSIAGRDLQPRRLGAAQTNEDDRSGPSTGKVLLIASGILLLAVGGAVLWLIDKENDRGVE